MQQTIRYIIEFLLGDTCTAGQANLIGYTADATKFSQYKLVIIPSNFFDDGVYGTKESLPALPLSMLDAMPILYGKPTFHTENETLIVEADFIASAYFLLSGYEAFVKRDVRDAHGRFPGKESIAVRQQFIQRPIVDEYGRWLREHLREMGINIKEPTPELKKIYLTHDVDIPFFYRTVKSFIGGMARGKVAAAIKGYFGKLTNNPVYTFPWIIAQNKKLGKSIGGNGRCETIFFFKAGGGTAEDKPVYNLHSKDIRQLFSLCRDKGVHIGLHASYYAGIHPTAIAAEKQQLEKATQSVIYYNRHHYLACREPEDFEYLISCGITDDFTMSYADVAGFRLGTCRPVQWINPANKVLQPLTLHPLTVMDATLDGKKYMNLSFEEAKSYCLALINETEKHTGELTLLWHNNNLTTQAGNRHKELYEFLIEHLASM